LNFLKLAQTASFFLNMPFENHLKTLRWCIKKISESFKSLRKGEITVPLGFIFKLEIFERFFNKALMMSV